MCVADLQTMEEREERRSCFDCFNFFFFFEIFKYTQMTTKGWISSHVLDTASGRLSNYIILHQDKKIIFSSQNNTKQTQQPKVSTYRFFTQRRTEARSKKWQNLQQTMMDVSSRCMLVLKWVCTNVRSI